MRRGGGVVAREEEGREKEERREERREKRGEERGGERREEGGERLLAEFFSAFAGELGSPKARKFGSLLGEKSLLRAC